MNYRLAGIQQGCLVFGNGEIDEPVPRRKVESHVEAVFGNLSCVPSSQGFSQPLRMSARDYDAVDCLDGETNQRIFDRFVVADNDVEFCWTVHLCLSGFGLGG